MPFPPQKQGNGMGFSLKHILKYYGLREGKQRLGKFVNTCFSRKQNRCWKRFLKTCLSNNKGNILEGSRDRFHRKTYVLILPPWQKPIFYFVFGCEKRPPSNFRCPKGTVFIGFSNLSLPSAENREEPRILCWNYGFCGSENNVFLFSHP